jgi:hypothetical protein
MKTTVRTQKGHYVFKQGYPLILAAGFEYSVKNHIAELWWINANYNNVKSTIAQFAHTQLNTAMSLGLSIDEALEAAIDKFVYLNEQKLGNSTDELVLKALPIVFTKGVRQIELQLITGIEELKVQMLEQTKNPDMMLFVENIKPLSFDFRFEP